MLFNLSEKFLLKKTYSEDRYVTKNRRLTSGGGQGDDQELCLLFLFYQLPFI